MMVLHERKPGSTGFSSRYHNRVISYLRVQGQIVDKMADETFFQGQDSTHDPAMDQSGIHENAGFLQKIKPDVFAKDHLDRKLKRNHITGIGTFTRSSTLG